MKKIVSVACILMLVSLLIAPFGIAPFGSAAQAKKIAVGLSWNEKKHALIQMWEDYMKQSGEEYGKKHDLDFEWIITVADSDPAQQNSQIENLVIQGPDVIVARAQDAAAIGAAIRAAHEAGIAFVTFDRECSTMTPDAHVGGDSLNQARTTAYYFAGLLQGMGIKPKVVELMGDLRDINAVYRHDMWHAVEKELGAWETVVEVPTEWNPEKFYSGTLSAFRAHPEANAMFVASDFCFDAVVSALKDLERLHPRGEKGHIWIASQDVQPQGYAAMVKGYMDVMTTYDIYLQAEKLAEILGRIAAGEDLKGRRFLVRGRVATPENIEKLPNLWAREYKE